MRILVSTCAHLGLYLADNVPSKLYICNAQNIKNMNNYYFIYIECEKYIAEYILKHFGVWDGAAGGDLFQTPRRYVEFGNTSPEQKILFRFMDRLPKGEKPDLPTETSIAVKLPMKLDKRPRDGFTYFSPAAKKHLIAHLVAILDAHITMDFLEALKESPTMNVTNYFYAWCEANGIDTDDGKAPETLRQKLYRIRKSWKKEKSINLV